MFDLKQVLSDNDLYKCAIIATGTTIPKKYILNENYHYVKKYMANNGQSRIKIVDLKGLGKSCTLLTTYAESLLLEKPCILLRMGTMCSHNACEVISYFTNCFDCTGINTERGLIDHILQYVEKSKPCYLWI